MQTLSSCGLLTLITCCMFLQSTALSCYECTQPKGKNLACEVNVAAVQQSLCPEGQNCVKYVWTCKFSNTPGADNNHFICHDNVKCPYRLLAYISCLIFLCKLSLMHFGCIVK